jgi:hypothetical protein
MNKYFYCLKNNQMNYRFTLITFLTIIVNLSFVHNASAQVQPADCSFSSPAPGNLITEGIPLASRLVSGSGPEVTSATVSVTCKENAKLIVVPPPKQILGDDIYLQSYKITVKSPSAQWNQDGDPLINLPGNSGGLTTNLIIDLAIEKGSVLSAGKYRYLVKLQAIK